MPTARRRGLHHAAHRHAAPRPRRHQAGAVEFSFEGLDDEEVRRGFMIEAKGSLKEGETAVITVSFTLKEEAMAGTELGVIASFGVSQGSGARASSRQPAPAHPRDRDPSQLQRGERRRRANEAEEELRPRGRPRELDGVRVLDAARGRATVRTTPRTFVCLFYRERITHFVSEM